MKNLFCSALFILSVLTAAAAGPDSLIQIKELKLNDSVWTVAVKLPEDYSAEQKYPVIYMLHGNGDNHKAWYPAYPLIDSLTRAGLIPPVITVTPSGKRGWWVDAAVPYEWGIVNVLIPYIDSAYSTAAERNGRLIAGYSMGGYGALRYGLAYPDIFGSSIVMSPALYDNLPPDGSSARTTGAFGLPFDSAKWDSLNYPAEFNRYKAKNLPVNFFIGAGDDDWHHTEGEEYNVEHQIVKLYTLLHKNNKVPAELRITNGGHDWDVWLKLLREFLPDAFKTMCD